MYECPDDPRLDPDYKEDWQRYDEDDEDPDIDLKIDEAIYERWQNEQLTNI